MSILASQDLSEVTVKSTASERGRGYGDLGGLPVSGASALAPRDLCV
jgi:hypothetical protein